jgi:hypothetical protein
VFGLESIKDADLGALPVGVQKTGSSSCWQSRQGRQKCERSGEGKVRRLVRSTLPGLSLTPAENVGVDGRSLLEPALITRLTLTFTGSIRMEAHASPALLTLRLRSLSRASSFCR